MFEELFTESARAAMILAAEQAYLLSHQAVGTEHILLGLAREENGIAGKALRSMGADYQTLMDEVNLIHGQRYQQLQQQEIVIPYSPRSKKIIMNASTDAKRLGSPKVGTEHLLLGMLKEEIYATVLLENIGIDLTELRKTVYQMIGMEQENMNRNQRRRPGRMGNQQAEASNGKQSSTPTLDDVSRDLTQLAKDDKLDPVIGRRQEIRRIIQILARRTKNNPVLVGEPGVGKTAIAEGLARQIVEGNVPPAIQGKRLMMLDIAALVAGTKYRGEFE